MVIIIIISAFVLLPTQVALIATSLVPTPSYLLPIKLSKYNYNVFLCGDFDMLTIQRMLAELFHECYDRSNDNEGNADARGGGTVVR